MGGPRPKVPKIRIKTGKIMKAEKMSKEMLAADAMLIKAAEMEVDPKRVNDTLDQESEGETLEIDDNFIYDTPYAVI